jgi:hypothetical protein
MELSPVIAESTASLPVAARICTQRANAHDTGDKMEIREVPESKEDSRNFRDSLKAWQNRESADEARAEDEGMVADVALPEPEVVEQDRLDDLEANAESFKAAEVKRR